MKPFSSKVFRNEEQMIKAFQKSSPWILLGAVGASIWGIARAARELKPSGADLSDESALSPGYGAGPNLTSREASRKLQKHWGDRKSRDAVEQASWESFPASDPPAW